MKYGVHAVMCSLLYSLRESPGRGTESRNALDETRKKGRGFLRMKPSAYILYARGLESPPPEEYSRRFTRHGVGRFRYLRPSAHCCNPMHERGLEFEDCWWIEGTTLRSSG